MSGARRGLHEDYVRNETEPRQAERYGGSQPGRVGMMLFQLPRLPLHPIGLCPGSRMVTASLLARGLRGRPAPPFP